MNRFNEDYRIITAIPTGKDTEIVIGHALNPHRLAQYVVWDCKGKCNYNNGGYTMNYRQALAVMANRIQQDYDFLPIEAPAPKSMSNSDRLETIGCFIDIFEDFLEEKGIDIPNEEKEQDFDDNAAIIYGTDYGNLSDRIEHLLINIDALEEEE